MGGVVEEDGRLLPQKEERVLPLSRGKETFSVLVNELLFLGHNRKRI